MIRTSAVSLTVLLLLTCPVSYSSAAEQAGHSAPQPDYAAPKSRKDLDDAVAAADARVAAARARANQDPLVLAEALTSLGDALLAKEDHASAFAAFDEALKIVERNDANSARAFGPLRGMGFALAETGQHKEALPYLKRALAIARATYGVFDSRQLDVLRELSDSLSVLGLHDEAKENMFYTLRIAEKMYGEGDPRVAPAISALGDWFSEIGRPMAARYCFEFALRGVEAKLGSKDLAAVEPLRGLARTDMRAMSYHESALRIQPKGWTNNSAGHDIVDERKLTKDGERALRRALQILDANPQAPRAVLIDTLIQLGDWLQIKKDSRQALPYYQRAWTLLATQESPVTEFEFPVRVYYPTPFVTSRSLPSGPAVAGAGYVQVEFTVNEDGSVSAARVVGHDATELYAQEILKAVSVARYRPRFVDGQPVSTPAMIYRESLRTRGTPDR